jgi:uncharacterized phage protein gp47/JayE
MTINIPENSEEVIQRSKTDVRLNWAGSNPFLKNSAIAAITISFSNRVYDFYLQMKEVVKQSFPDTATDIYLERWANIFGRPILAATKSSGKIVVTGVPLTTISEGTFFSTSNGTAFSSTSSVDVLENNISISSIVRSGNIATVTTFLDHGLVSSVEVEISGAVESSYNSVFNPTVTGSKTFTYPVQGVPASPASGSNLSAKFNSVEVPVKSEDFSDSKNGIEINLDSETELSFQSPIINVDREAYVGQGKIFGGLDRESDSALRIRLLERIQNPVSNFNSSAIISKAKEINGVTRVWVEEVTPLVGQVTIYFMRDLDSNAIPSTAEVLQLKNKILEIKPANTIDEDVIVSAPQEVLNSFIFSQLTPDNSIMREALKNNLKQFFDEETNVGQSITEEKYISAIQNTIDTEGNGIDTFSLSSPIGDISVSSGEIATFEMVSYL